MNLTRLFDPVRCYSMRPLIILGAVFAVALCAAFMPAHLFAGDYGTITAAELKAMIDRKEPGLLVIDSRSRRQHEEEHIPGAISLPLSDMEQDASLPQAPRDARLVFYCSGTT